jgi:long-chain acyl-CoA synthetase
MPKFDALAVPATGAAHRATHTMLVPVQYQRLMARPEFDNFDLSQLRSSSSAPARRSMPN